MTGVTLRPKSDNEFDDGATFLDAVIGYEGTTSYAGQQVTADLSTGNTFVHSQTANENITDVDFTNPPSGTGAVQKVTLIIINNRADTGALTIPTTSGAYEIDGTGSLCYGDWPATGTITYQDLTVISFTYVQSLAKGLIEFGEDRSL